VKNSFGLRPSLSATAVFAHASKNCWLVMFSGRRLAPRGFVGGGTAAKRKAVLVEGFRPTDHCSARKYSLKAPPWPSGRERYPASTSPISAAIAAPDLLQERIRFTKLRGGIDSAFQRGFVVPPAEGSRVDPEGVGGCERAVNLLEFRKGSGKRRAIMRCFIDVRNCRRRRRRNKGKKVYWVSMESNKPAGQNRGGKAGWAGLPIRH